MIRTNQCVMLKRELVNLPTTRYLGSKQKIVSWIWDTIQDMEFDSFLDLFGGTGIVGYVAKLHGKEVFYNDTLLFNSIIGKAIIENNEEQLMSDDVDFILRKHNFEYPSFIENKFKDVYFTNEENKWLDIVITNIKHIENKYKQALAFYCLFQSCIRKRPYNLFHRKNLYVRFANVKRGFGNKTTWDTPFDVQFKEFVEEVNNLVFDNKRENKSLNHDSLKFPQEISADLIYIDTPYFSAHSNIGVDYKDFYHFLEGICEYDEWNDKIDNNSKHFRLKKEKTVWEDKYLIHTAFDTLFKKFQGKIIVVSYRSAGIPSEEEMIALLKKYKTNIQVVRKEYKYALSNNDGKELLFIAT
ncbi:DNA adenine methylase [Candidatus Woesearchaeota archaeon]|nr:DNA adenine methylase [Candidatus Woesearchaeota archaeon]